MELIKNSADTNNIPVVLITGIAGFIGMHAALRFLNEGWRVIGIDNLNDYYSVELKKARLRELQSHSCSQTLEVHLKDINSSIWEELEDRPINVILHLAAQAGVRYSISNPEAYLHSNVLGFQKVLAFAIKKEHAKLLYASSSSVYGKTAAIPFTEDDVCATPESFYAATKRFNELAAHAYFQTHSLTSIGLRFFTVYGPWGRPDMAPMLFCKAAYSGSEIRVFNYGRQSRDFTYIDDVIEGIYMISVGSRSTKPMILNIGNGEPVHLMDFIKEIELQTGRTLQKAYVEAQKGDVPRTFASTKRLQELYGYKPKVRLAEGVKRFVSWYTQEFNH